MYVLEVEEAEAQKKSFKTTIHFSFFDDHNDWVTLISYLTKMQNCVIGWGHQQQCWVKEFRNSAFP